MTHRFFIEPGRPSQPGEILTLPDKIAHQVRAVLHLDVGEQLVLLDNSGDELLCTLSQSSKHAVTVEVIERRVGKSESAIQIVLCQGMLKSARFEWILEKGTELGVTTFAPVLCKRSLAGLDDAGSAKQQRWHRIIQEATEQCGRARYPQLLPIRPLAKMLAELPSGSLALMPWEEEQGVSLHAALHSLPLENYRAEDGALTIYLFIGPEGGLTPEEAELARRAHVQTVSLGRRILRAETAALATVANVMYELEGR